jgi:putative membrane protein
MQNAASYPRSFGNQSPAVAHCFPTAPALALILAAYIAARVLEIVPSPIPRTAIVALDVLSALAFALVLGTRTHRLRGILVFAGFCILIGNTTENLSISTGFPFGHYFFLELMGPKLFQVPILLGLAYIGMAYVSWVLGTLIAGRSRSLLAIPLTASFIMVAWDVAQDPVWSTVLHGWVWRDGGHWFGVPFSNYLGWYLTVFLIYLCFALYLRRRPAPPNASNPAIGRPAISFYALCAAANVCQVFGHRTQTVVQDPTGHAWVVADITAASALVSIFVMGGFAVLALVRLGRQSATTD